jgi:hypothetical protein
MRVSFNVEKDEATPTALRLKAAAADRLSMNLEAAKGMLPVVQRSLNQMSLSNHNAFGVRDTFWKSMLSGTRFGADDEGGYVSTPRPVALRYFGGTVVPTNTTYLAIPARSEAYGKTPKDFSDLRFVLFASGSAALVQTALPTGAKTRGRKKDAQGRGSIDARAQGGGVFYWLVKSATINPDPDVLPTPEEIEAGAVRGVASYFRSARRGGNA